MISIVTETKFKFLLPAYKYMKGVQKKDRTF